MKPSAKARVLLRQPQERQARHTELISLEMCLQYYSAITKNEIKPFAATWMDPEMTILRELSQKEKNKDMYVEFRKMVQMKLFAGQE